MAPSLPGRGVAVALVVFLSSLEPSESFFVNSLEPAFGGSYATRLAVGDMALALHNAEALTFTAFPASTDGLYERGYIVASLVNLVELDASGSPIRQGTALEPAPAAAKWPAAGPE